MYPTLGCGTSGTTFLYFYLHDMDMNMSRRTCTSTNVGTVSRHRARPARGNIRTRQLYEDALTGQAR
eukprot:5706668-Prymnesium_polylepis.1